MPSQNICEQLPEQSTCCQWLYLLSLFPPLLRQLAGGGGGEDGLAEAFEDGGHAVEAFAAGVYPREDRVELVGDALLFVEGRKRTLNSSSFFVDILASRLVDCRPQFLDQSAGRAARMRIDSMARTSLNRQTGLRTTQHC